MLKIIDDLINKDYLFKQSIRFSTLSVNLTILSNFDMKDSIKHYFPESNSEGCDNISIISLASEDIYNQIYGKLANYTPFKKRKMHKSQNSDVYIYDIKCFQIWNDEQNNFILIKENNEKYYVIFKENLNGAIYLVRIIRELYYELMEKNNNLMLHAAAFEWNNKGILVCGSKCSGKTTTLIRFLDDKANFISNDRVFLKKENKENYFLSYFPLPIRIGLGTMINSKLSNFTDNNEFYRKQNIDTVSKEELIKFGCPVKYEVTPHELTKFYDCRFLETTVLDYIIFPKYIPNYNGFLLEPVNKSDVLSSLIDCCMTPRDDDWPDRWIMNNENNLLEAIENAVSVLEDITKKYPSYKLLFGNQLFEPETLKIK